MCTSAGHHGKVLSFAQTSEPGHLCARRRPPRKSPYFHVRQRVFDVAPLANLFGDVVAVVVGVVVVGVVVGDVVVVSVVVAVEVPVLVGVVGS